MGARAYISASLENLTILYEFEGLKRHRIRDRIAVWWYVWRAGKRNSWLREYE